MRRIPSILVLILVVSMVGISGCTNRGGSIYSSGIDSNTTTNKSTASKEEIKVLSTKAYRDSTEYYTIDGEIQNNYNREVGSVEIVGVGYDSSGNVVSTKTGYAYLYKIPPGGKSPFKLFLDDPNNRIVKYDLQMQPGFLELLLKDIKNTLNPFTANKSTASKEEIKVLSTKVHRDGIGNYIVDGQIQNNYNTEVGSAEIVGIGYDSSGNVVATTVDYAYLDKIPPGGKSPFKLDFDDPNNEIVKYDLQTQLDPMEFLKNVVDVSSIYSSGIDSNTTTNKSTASKEEIKVLNAKAHRDSKGNYTYYAIDGEIQNNYNTEVGSVEIIGTGYDSSGNVVATNYAYAYLDKIPPGGKSSFKLDFDDPNNEIVKYDLQTQIWDLNISLNGLKNRIKAFFKGFGGP